MVPFIILLALLLDPTTPRELYLVALFAFSFLPKVAEVRKGLEERQNNAQKASALAGDGKPKEGVANAAPVAGSGAMDSHMREVKKAEDNRRMREAFGLGDDYAAGEAFDEDAQERKKEARKK